jgi:serine/tyrosine/threonine adenylyltransferase
LFSFSNTYTHLPHNLYSKAQAHPYPKAKLALYNTTLAQGMQLPAAPTPEQLQILSGQIIQADSIPIAQAYAGHQFGHFNILGDGRALLLGEHHLPNDTIVDVQLKGSGSTAYSRRGDGKGTLYAMLREYLIAEAMHYMGIPSTRSLAVFTTGELVYRQQVQMGGLLVRVASSHIRVGTFEYAASLGNTAILEALLQYTFKRHYSHINNSQNIALTLLQEVMQRQIQLIAQWMSVGFIHGVMNTDNMSIAGETIDYGPCAFMNTYHPGTVFSSIDTQGRYAYGNQANIAHWNIVCFANTLLPLIHHNADEAVQMAQAVINTFKTDYELAYYNIMAKKIGITNSTEAHKILIDELLHLMQQLQLDYTNTFVALNNIQQGALWHSDEAWQIWHAKWYDAIKYTEAGSLQLMQRTNPCYIPRNHLVEDALVQASEYNNYTTFNNLLNVLQQPYNYTAMQEAYQQIPPNVDAGYTTYCGT